MRGVPLMAATRPSKLIARLATGEIREFELGVSEIRIGKESACEICIPSKYVSRLQASISRSARGFLIKNESRTNPTQINGRTLREPQILESGDRLQAGDVLLTFEEGLDDPLNTVAFPIPQRIDAVASPRISRSAGTWTILYTDLVAHTQLVTKLGDLAGQRWLRAHNDILRRQFALHEGMEDNWRGDGFLVTFPGARRALLCAVAIQRELRDYNRGHPDTPMLVRMGLHTGEILREGDELFGAHVILASRIMENAGAGEILVSDLLYRLVRTAGEFEIVERGLFELKGFPEPERLYEVRWQEDEPASGSA